MKDLRASIIVGVKDLLNENIKEFMKEVAVSVKGTIVEYIPSQVANNIHTTLNHKTQLEPIT